MKIKTSKGGYIDSNKINHVEMLYRQNKTMRDKMIVEMLSGKQHIIPHAYWSVVRDQMALHGQKIHTGGGPMSGRGV